MNKKYERYINFIVSDIKPPYYENMRDIYGLSEKEYEMVLSKVFNQPVLVRNYKVYNTNDNLIYYEDSNGFWYKREYDSNGNNTYYEDSNGFWVKREYDDYGYQNYYENEEGDIEDNR